MEFCQTHALKRTGRYVALEVAQIRGGILEFDSRSRTDNLLQTSRRSSLAMLYVPLSAGACRDA